MIVNILIATLLISLISLVGLIVSHKHIKKFLHYFISFAAGTLIASSFFDLIPYALEELQGVHIEESLIFLVGGVILFFLVEKFVHWHHCDKEECDKRPAGLLILTGDFVHNFIDGVLIAGAFLLNVTTGIVTVLTVAIHEIPQELGDYAVLIHSGYKRKKALMLNFFSALTAVLGGIVGFLIFERVSSFTPLAVLVTAGGFIYIALSDIVPHLHKHKEQKVMIIETLIFVFTIVILYFLLRLAH